MSDWRVLLRSDVQDFIIAHAEDDVRTLALKRPDAMADFYPLVLEQIAVRQKAQAKSPVMYDTHGIIFPSSHDFEQSSSLACGLYKASLVRGERFIDLTAGTGVDAFCFAQRFSFGVCVEKQAVGAEILEHNLAVLKRAGHYTASLDVQCQDAVQALEQTDEVDFIFIDPQRRDNSRKGLFQFSDCSPDVGMLADTLVQKARRVLVKASPVLDIQRAIEALRFVRGVYIVQWQGECREVLYLLERSTVIHGDSCDGSPVHVHAVDVYDDGKVLHQVDFTFEEERNLNLSYGMPQQYIYEPGPAFQKAGCFQIVAARFGVTKIHRHTHLYTHEKIVPDFPGKVYEIVDVLPVRKGRLPFDRCEMKLRNFPGHVDDLRKKLGVREGGVYRVYAATLANDEKRLIVCKRISS